VCLIRSDLTTIWCEVTSSLRTKDNDDDSGDINSLLEVKNLHQSSSSVENLSRKMESEVESMHESDDANLVQKVTVMPQVKEILLCLRPIRDGDNKTDEINRFKPQKKNYPIVSEDNRSSVTTSASPLDGFVADSNEAINSWGGKNNRQKRTTKDSQSVPNKKKRRASVEDIDTAVVESLMSMSNKKV
jgi:hypothetical protein